MLVNTRPETSPDAVALHSGTHALSDRVGDARRHDRVGTHEGHRHRTSAVTDTRCERPEGGPVPDTPDQADSRSRPLRRRAARTARPARVLMRTRNPCVFLRLRLFGWNVRFTVLSPGRSANTHPIGAVRALGFRPCDSQEAGRIPRNPLRANRIRCPDRRRMPCSTHRRVDQRRSVPAAMTSVTLGPRASGWARRGLVRPRLRRSRTARSGARSC